MRRFFALHIILTLLVCSGTVVAIDPGEDRFQPLSSVSWNDRGEDLRKKGDFDGAIKAFTESIRQDPAFAWPHNNRGLARAAKGEFDEALKDYAEAIRLDPKYAFPFNNRGLVHVVRNNLDDAIKDYSAAIQIDPKYMFPYYNRGIAWVRKREYAKGIADFAEAIQLEPKSAAPHNEIAWIRATCADPQFRGGKEAILYATKACELTDWNSFSELDTLAAAYAEAGEFTMAVIWGLTALEKAPEKERENASLRLELYRAGKSYHQQPDPEAKLP